MPNSGAAVRIGGDKAFYSPPTDHIQLPPDGAFRGPHEWAATALHELGHWTGHGSRLNRDMGKRFGSAGYAMEETRAELASAFLAGELGIPADIPNHASYIRNWLKPFKDDKCEIFRAAADAQKIVVWILNYHPAYAARFAPSRPDPSKLVVPHQSVRLAATCRKWSFAARPQLHKTLARRAIRSTPRPLQESVLGVPLR